MLVTAHPSADRPIYRQIVDQLRQFIAAGSLRPGDRLPPVRQLAADLGVNLNTVATAYRELAAEGLVEVHHGRGARVAAHGRQDLDEDEIHGLLRPALSKMLLAGKTDREIVALVRQELRAMRGEQA